MTRVRRKIAGKKTNLCVARKSPFCQRPKRPPPPLPSLSLSEASGNPSAEARAPGIRVAGACARLVVSLPPPVWFGSKVPPLPSIRLAFLREIVACVSRSQWASAGAQPRRPPWRGCRGRSSWSWPWSPPWPVRERLPRQGGGWVTWFGLLFTGQPEPTPQAPPT